MSPYFCTRAEPGLLFAAQSPQTTEGDVFVGVVAAGTSVAVRDGSAFGVGVDTCDPAQASADSVSSTAPVKISRFTVPSMTKRQRRNFVPGCRHIRGIR